MKTSDIRKAFLDFFNSKNHEVVASSSLVPSNDETLLFTNAGMVQFKDVFLGTETKNFKRAATSQRCIRAGGKHNDLENVGYTLRHHTFFEMLGNFSFGDYFKEDAIKFAWEFLTEELKLDKEKLWITVYKDDDEAEEIWKNIIGIDPGRIARLGDDDNFWSMGDTGPCGPCSEIFYDHGEHIDGTPPGAEGDEGDRFIEIWNLVFMQFNRDESGKMEPLPKPSVDTGMGLERIAAVLQSVNSNYETDVFKDLINASEKILGSEGSTSHKVIADHIRSSVFLISDGVIPEKEGRGYVLRRIMRRGIRHGYKIGAKKPFMHLLVKDLIKLMNSAYPELKKKQKDIIELIKNEEIKFFETLETGIEILEDTISNMKNKTLSGDVVFKLHDTYGFPFDLTADIAREKQLDIDEERFNECMNQQKQTSKASSSFVSSLPAASGIEETKFLGYENLESDSKVLVIWKDQERIDAAKNKEEIFFACNQTPFYAEAGGQIGDKGKFASQSSTGSILDCKKQGKVYIHKAIVDKGSIKTGDVIKMSVEKEKRSAIAIHHSSTHLVHAALRAVLGDHVQQKGSLVDENKLRFDFSHTKPLTKEEITKIEDIVNKEALKNLEVKTELMKLDDALKSGAMALFGEKYDDDVRVLTMGENSYSVELCGGTHVNRTGDIGFFVITNQSSVASGIRRIEALAGSKSIEHVKKLRDVNLSLQNSLNVSADELQEKVNSLIEENKKLKKSSKSKSAKKSVISSEMHEFGDWKLIVEQVDVEDTKDLRSLADEQKNTNEKLCVVIFTESSNKIALVCGVTKNLTESLSAKEVVSELSNQINGKGGGRSDFAQGAGETDNIKDFVTSIPNSVKSLAK
ncbi:alanine--tRNA ligase [Gammaproteobacteria bacterium]|nr:alanine--tRNA ligase [Gammaproteobacteria bacterium]